MFCSTSKISFPGAGVAAMAASPANIVDIKKRMSSQTIGYDKINMLRHVRFFRDLDGIKAHMRLHEAVLRPKFAVVLDTLERRLAGRGIASWHKPNGGYFVSVNVMDGCAKETVAQGSRRGDDRRRRNLSLWARPAGCEHPRCADLSAARRTADGDGTVLRVCRAGLHQKAAGGIT